MAAGNAYHRRHFWRSVATVLAAIVVFCTTYALILPAITMEKTPTCTLEEHVHEDACFAAAAVLNCEVHRHTDSCYDGDGVLSCAMADFCVHTHGDDCYLSTGELLCTLPEITAHTHTESCTETGTILHQHSEDCMEKVQGDLICGLEETSGHSHAPQCLQETVTLVCAIPEGEGHSHGEGCLDAEGNLICELEESAAHTHDDTCRITESNLICGLEETTGHTHGENCFVWTQTVVCGMEEGQEILSEPVLVCTLEEIILHTHGESCYSGGLPVCGFVQITEHVHSEACLSTSEEQTCVCTIPEHTHDPLLCYIDPEADLETAQQWESMLPKNLSGVWAEDLLAVAESQLGYSESEYNLQVDAEGFVRGYTRYGAWYGEPYSDWNEIFVSFCLHYAGIDRESMAYESNAQRWITVLNAREQFAAAEYTPVPGDLVFMDLDDNGYSDTVAIVKDLTDHQLTVIQGDTETRSVEQIVYTLSDVPVEGEQVLLPGDILGYGILPENPASGEETTEATETESAETETAETEPSEAVQQVIGEIEALPAPEEIDAAVDAFEAQEDESGLEAWYMEVSARVQEAYGHYSALTEEEKAAVTNADKLMALEYIWSADTLEEPVEQETEEETSSDITHGQLSVSGQYYHSNAYKYYQISGQRVTQSDIMTFPLIPGEDYHADWAPEPTVWSAKTDANYLVAYCAECLVVVSDTGAAYDAFSMDNSRFGSFALRKQLAGVIAHSYPYLTLEEMRGELKAAYERGETSVDLSGAVESECMAATQAAIWQLLIPTMNFTGFTQSDAISDETLTALTVNPLANGGSSEYCDEIMAWLLTQVVPDDLAVADYDYTVEKGLYDMYTLTVTGTLNRPIIAGERVSLQMIAGDQSTELTYPAAGTESFLLELTGLTEQELMNAVVSLSISGERMQAYYFENAQYQDLIAGQWESYYQDLSFEVTKGSTSVSVTKHWTEDLPDNGMEVEVILYANGTQVRERALLNAGNAWTYTWLGLDQYDALGSPIVYTVQEMPVSGYYSTVTAVEGTNQTIPVWEEADGFEDGGQYLLISDIGGLAAYNQSASAKRLKWIAADPGNASAYDRSLVWQAIAADNGEFYLYSESVNGTLGYKDKIGGIYYRAEPLGEDNSAAWMTFRFHDGVLTGTYGDKGNLDFSYIGTNSGVSGRGYFRDYSGMTYSYAQEMTLYKLTQKEVPPADICFFLTNTAIREDIPLISVAVVKQWAGRPDETYPESAEVQLLQNGREYDVPVVLSEENSWQCRWDGLPQTDNDGSVFVYTVKEIGCEDYEQTQEAVLREDGVHSIMLTNTWSPEKLSVELRKADCYSMALLPGAEFDLYLATNNTGEPIPGCDDVLGIVVESIEVNAEGTAPLELVAGETYYLVETVAPAGYFMLRQPIGFTVEKRGTLVTITLLSEMDWVIPEADTMASITVLNRSDYKLPETGGAGTTLYTMGGLLLMVSAGLLLMHNHKKRRREVY